MRKKNTMRINGATLELIMRDVLYGVRDFTCEANRDSQPCKMDIISVEKEAANLRHTAQILPFRKPQGS